MFLRALLKQPILEIKHNLSDKLFQSLLLFTINEFSRGVLTFNLCALEVLVFVSETSVTKSVKYEGQFYIQMVKKIMPLSLAEMVKFSLFGLWPDFIHFVLPNFVL
jgi:hypothetical protein